MATIIADIEATPNPISNDGFQSSIVSATVSPAAADVSVTWTVVGGESVSVSPTTTDANGVATFEVKSNLGSSSVSVTAKTAEDTTGMTAFIGTYTPYTIPTVINASADDTYTLDHYDINFGVQAEIPVYADVSVNQIVTFYWGDIDSVQFIVTDTNLPPFIIDVTNDLDPACLANGQYNVYYTVTERDNTQNSSPIPLIVSDDGQTVPTEPAPEVPEADPYINISDAGNGVKVNISYPNMLAGDKVTCFWTGYDSAQRKLVGAEYTDFKVIVDETALTFTVGSTYFYPNGKGYEGYADVFYKVEPADASPALLSETKQCLVDTLAG